MKKKNMKWKKYGSTGHEDGGRNTWYIGKVMGTNTSMDSRIRVTACKTGDRRLLDEVFKLKPIKRGGKIPL